MSIPPDASSPEFPEQASAGAASHSPSVAGTGGSGGGGSPTVTQLAALAAWREEVRAAGERHRAASAPRFSLRALFVLLTLACVGSAALGFLVQAAAHALARWHSARETLDSVEAEAVQILRQGAPPRQAPQSGIRVYSDHH